MEQASIKHILGYAIFNGTANQLTAEIESRLARLGQVCLFYANSNLMQLWHGEQESLRQESIVMANDGIALDLVAKTITGSRFVANLNGTDYTPHLLATSARCKRVFLLGAKPGVADLAAVRFGQLDGVSVVGTADGYGQMADEAALIERINESGAQVLLVALGNPKQEAWLLAHRHVLKVPLLVGVGALLDFMSGNVKRAPSWVQRMHLEWFYRLLGEPGRLLRRYTLEMGRFFWLCFAYERQHRKAGLANDA
ncbi:WecB/TagA/CpsF family glycosyltransferase [Pseudaeromonas paramecii]|uniref:WecB/TagA/CpsF family glycosyltransferase n=1 Tax=Pseudaeromonas paramecii TaxID=2138166 RepID=A0ABP8PSF9_9GAMM